MIRIVCWDNKHLYLCIVCGDTGSSLEYVWWVAIRMIVSSTLFEIMAVVCNTNGGYLCIMRCNTSGVLVYGCLLFMYRVFG